MRRLIKFLVRPILKKYKDMVYRVSTLEKALECLIESPKWVDSQDIGFNGQRHRKLIFQDIIRTSHFDAIFETGTWTGNTTGYMAQTTNLPVYTCELVKLYHSLAKMRLQDIPNITFSLTDSRTFLKSMSNTDLSEKKVFIYLDAHWYEDLPLREELEVICSRWKDFVIMIDDFQVPNDNGYKFDSYGKGKVLSLDIFSNLFSQYGLIPFFPALPSNEETGRKRGCVVLAKQGEFSEILNGLHCIRR